jgi:hypothetical protein
MTDIKVGEFNIGEAVAIGISKQISERVLMRFTGNSSYMSGALKLGLSWGVGKYAPSMGGASKIIATGLAVDGAEDIALNIVNMLMGTEQQQEAEASIFY